MFDRFLNYVSGSPTNICMFEFKNRNTRKQCEICSRLTIKTTDNVVIVNFDHISQLFLMFLLLTLNKKMLAGSCLEISL